MTETELKFQIPAPALAPLRERLAAQGAQAQRLRAAYVDTPDRRLAAARAALRLRHEGEVGWVQTAKALGRGILTRLEHEAPAGQGAALPALALERHDGTPAGVALREALGDAAEALAVVFETDVERLRLDQPAPGGGWVELALDEGEVRAGEHRLALAELELELRSGEPAGLLGMAAALVAEHGLWLDVRSKAERGHLLAQGVAAVSPARGIARPGAGLPAPAAVAALLDPLLAAGSVLADPALESADRQPHLAQWQQGLAHLLHVLGSAALSGGVPPHPDWAAELVALLAPLDAQPSVAAAGRIARGARYNRLVLALIGWSQPL